MKIVYRSNNSGGNWWLKDKDWKNLEKAGWKVHWRKDAKYDGIMSFMKPGKDGRWLGALATSAEKEFESITDALKEFERITGQDVSDEGCNCCGAPHSFDWEGGYCSGEDCLQYLYKNVPQSLREACEEMEPK